MMNLINLIGAHVLLKIDENYKLERHDLLIQNNTIVAFDYHNQSIPQINMEKCTFFPAFFNLHCHLGESIFKNISGKNWTLDKYLNYTNKINQNMSVVRRQAEWEKSSLDTILALKKEGTVGFCAARSAEICQKYSFNNMSGYPIMNSEKLIEYKEKGIEGFTNYYKKNQNELCNVGVFFHSLYKNDLDSLKLAYKCLENNAKFLSVHISEDAYTRNQELKAYKKEPVYILDDFGLLNNNTILVHCGYTSKKELELIKRRNSVIAICPISNLFVNTQLADLNYIEELGINWCIATDGLATGRTFSMIKQALALKMKYPFLSYEKLFEKMTEAPAKSYNKCSFTGRIELGTQANFLVTKNIFKDESHFFYNLFKGNLNFMLFHY